MKKLILFLLIVSPIMMFGQSKTIADFTKKAGGSQYFAYQSMLRMLNVDQNPDFNYLIKDLEYLKVVAHKESQEIGKQSLSMLDRELSREGFEMIMSIDNIDYKLHVFESSSNGKKTTWLATCYAEDYIGVIEMVGSLNAKYLNAISSLDIDKIFKSMDFGEITEDWD